MKTTLFWVIIQWLFCGWIGYEWYKKKNAPVTTFWLFFLIFSIFWIVYILTQNF